MENKKENPDKNANIGNNNPQNQKNKNNPEVPATDKNRKPGMENTDFTPNANENQTPDNQRGNGMKEHETHQQTERYKGSKNPDGMDTDLDKRNQDFNEDIINDEENDPDLE